MSLKEKRIRSIDWDEEEKQLFRSVLKEFAKTIENKSLDYTAYNLILFLFTDKGKVTNSLSNNYVDTMVNYSKNLKDQEHKKRLEILEVELNIQKEKLKSAILERDILEIKKTKELLNISCAIYF